MFRSCDQRDFNAGGATRAMVRQRLCVTLSTEVQECADQWHGSEGVRQRVMTRTLELLGVRRVSV